MGISIRGVRLEPASHQQGVDPLPQGRTTERLVHQQWFADDFADTHPPVERTTWILKDDLHFSAHWTHGSSRKVEPRGALEVDRSGAGGDQSGESLVPAWSCRTHWSRPGPASCRRAAKTWTSGNRRIRASFELHVQIIDLQEWGFIRGERRTWRVSLPTLYRIPIATARV